MEVSFDTEKRGKNAPHTRIYAPSDKSSSDIHMQAEDDTPVRPQPLRFESDEQEAVAPVPTVKVPENEKIPVYSYVLLVLSVFIIAATAILAITGNAKVAQIYSEIYGLEDEITEYREQISMLRKEQSSLNDYNTISNANRGAGRIMTWDEEFTLSIGN